MRSFWRAGRARGLQAAVQDVPKPLAPIAGRPFLTYLLDRLEAHGIKNVILSVGYRHEAIAAALGTRYGSLSLSYAIEEEPLGTGGGLHQAMQLTDSYPILALNGDTYVELDYDAMLGGLEESGAEFSVAVRNVPDVSRFGRAVLEDGRVVGFAAKGESGPGPINCGVYLFARPLPADLPKKFSFEKDYLEARTSRLRPAAFRGDGYFIDIGVPEDYHRAQTELPLRAREAHA